MLKDIQKRSVPLTWFIISILAFIIPFQLIFYFANKLAENNQEIIEAKINELYAKKSITNEEGKDEIDNQIKNLQSEKGKWGEYITDLGLELFKTIVFGLIVGLAVEYYLRNIETDSLKQQFEKAKISQIYVDRQEAQKRFIELVNNKNVTSIDILGISLREFLTEQGKMRIVWEHIKVRLEEERDISFDKKLKVRLLLLDPKSSEGNFRYKIEKPTDKEFNSDIRQGALEIENVKTLIFEGKEAKEIFQARFYEHCPFSFILLTNTTSFIEQYFYHKPVGRSKYKAESFPLIEYGFESSKYNLINHTFDTMWKNANDERISVGTAIPFEEAKVKNIFRVDKRNEESIEQSKAIKNTQVGTIDILAIAAKHYIEDNNFGEAILDIPKEVVVRMALLNPVSKQAIYKSLTDRFDLIDIKQKILEYTWEKHRTSRLFSNSIGTLEAIKKWNKQGSQIEIKYYSSVSTRFLITENYFFVGKYTFGRSSKFLRLNELKAEFPVIQFERTTQNKSIEQEIVENTFEIIWDCFSCKIDLSNEQELEGRFKTNLEEIIDELGLKPQQNRS